MYLITALLVVLATVPSSTNAINLNFDGNATLVDTVFGIEVTGTLTGLGGSNNNGGGYVKFDILASGIVDELCYNNGDKLPPGQNRKSPVVLGSTTANFNDANGGNLPYAGEAGEECTCGVPDGSNFFDTFTTTARRRLGEGNGVDSKAAAAPLKGESYLRDPLEKSGRVLAKPAGGTKTTNTVQYICPAVDSSLCIFQSGCVDPYLGSDGCSCQGIACCEASTGDDPYQCPSGCACKVPSGFETCPKDTCSRGGKTCTNWKQFVSGMRYNQTIVEARISVCQGTADDAACIANADGGTLVQINRQVCTVATYNEFGLPGSDDGLVPAEKVSCNECQLCRTVGNLDNFNPASCDDPNNRDCRCWTTANTPWFDSNPIDDGCDCQDCQAVV